MRERLLYVVGYSLVFALTVGRGHAATWLGRHGLKDTWSLFAINCGIALAFLLITFLLVTTPFEPRKRK